MKKSNLLRLLQIRLFKEILFISVFFILISLQKSQASFKEIDYDKCLLTKESFNQVLQKIKDDSSSINSLAGCLQFNHQLIFQVCLIDPAQLENAKDIFRDNENFVARLMKINPEILQYASNRIRNDKIFIERVSYIDRDALKYAHPKLQDNKIFARKMLGNDSRNYMFISNRLKSFYEFAKLALSDDGGLLIYANDDVRSNKELVKIALNSSPEMYNFISDDLKNDPEIKNILKEKTKNFSKEKFEKFIKEKYLISSEDKNVGKKINENNYLTKDKILINRNYITKWHRKLRVNGYFLEENWNLIEDKYRNFPSYFKDDLKDYKNLSTKIENFLLKRKLDKNIVDNLYLTYLVKVKENPLTLVFNLQRISDSNDVELNDNFINLTSITAIASQKKDDFELSIVEVVFGKEIKTDISYRHGYKKYILYDLYFENKDDKDAAIIFKVEDKLNDYFEIFYKTSNDKYRLIYRIDPLKIKEKKDDLNEFGIKRTRQEQEEYEWEKLQKIEKKS